MRAAFSTDPSFSWIDSPTAAAILGTVCHRLMEGVVRGEFDDVGEGEVEAVVVDRWDKELAAQLERARQAPLATALREPSEWPFYHVKRGRLIKRASEEVKDRRRTLRSPAPVQRQAVEERYEGYERRLVGRADLVRYGPEGVEIIDFKTGAATEYDEKADAEVLRQAYRRQLLLYAALHHDNTGEWPTKATVDSLAGGLHSFEVDPAEGEAVVSQALAALDEYNSSVAKGDVRARPSPENCRFCPYRGVCDAFLQSVDASWDWYPVYVSGRVDEVTPVEDGSSLVSITAASGNVEQSDLVLHGVPDDELPQSAPRPKVSVAAAERIPRSPRDIRFGRGTQVWYW